MSRVLHRAGPQRLEAGAWRPALPARRSTRSPSRAPAASAGASAAGSGGAAPNSTSASARAAVMAMNAPTIVDPAVAAPVQPGERGRRGDDRSPGGYAALETRPGSSAGARRAVARADDRLDELLVVELAVGDVGGVAAAADRLRDGARGRLLLVGGLQVGLARRRGTTRTRRWRMCARRRDVLGAARLQVAGDVAADARRILVAADARQRGQRARVLGRLPLRERGRVAGAARRRAEVASARSPSRPRPAGCGRRIGAPRLRARGRRACRPPPRFTLSLL